MASDPLAFGGQTYAVPGNRVTVRLDVSRTTGAGFALRLRFDGPPRRRRACAAWRTRTPWSRWTRARSTSPAAATRLESPYLDDQELDLRAWAHDALALALPTQILCREDCAGLCVECGENLNATPTTSTSPSPTRAGPSSQS